ncbi:MAG: DUF3881 family protein [Lachnospiraceae bacterium]|nr:DUF3881 family protein [Lachnospiraceae bacterium]
MHQYLRAIGFSELKSKKELRELLYSIIEGCDTVNNIETDRKSVIVEYTKQFAGPCGITLRAEIDEEKNLVVDFYYPFLNAHTTSTCEDLSVERHSANESFAGICEDIRVGASIIFDLQNGVEYMKNFAKKTFKRSGNTIYLAGLSVDGMILLPIEKNAKELQRVKQVSSERRQKIIAAREGNEEAIEKLTIEDIDTYSNLSKRIHKEDIFTLVDTYFMPYGIECDHYSVLAEIEECSMYHNYITDEEIYVMTLNMNELKFEVCINKKDLLGEPQIGRRFKGNFILQGRVEFA